MVDDYLAKVRLRIEFSRIMAFHSQVAVELSRDLINDCRAWLASYRLASEQAETLPANSESPLLHDAG